MYPILFEIGNIKIGTYGVCLALAFFVAYWLFRKELLRKNAPIEAADWLLASSLFGGMVGGKLLFLFESMFKPEFKWELTQIYTGGFAALGGFLLAFGLGYLVMKSRRYDVATMFDAAAPSLMIAYGIARVGCQLSGDGDYGIASDLPWTMAYPNGTVPTTELVHPTPVYETLYSIGIFFWLWKKRLVIVTPYVLFGWYLIVSGTARFTVEFIRLNPEVFLSLTSSQWISVILVVVGIYIVKLRKQVSQY